MSALAWVDVACYETNVMETGLVRSEQKNGVWDLNGLRKLAGQDGARFLVIAGAFQPPEIPRFVSGQFSVHAVAP